MVQNCSEISGPVNKAQVQRALEVEPFQEVSVAHPGGGSSDQLQNQAEANLLLSVSITGENKHNCTDYDLKEEDIS